MTAQLQEIEKFLNDQFDPEFINNVPLPDFLLDPRTDEEINDRFYLIYHKLYVPLCITMRDSFRRELSKMEIGVVSERLHAYLKEQGF